MGRLITEVPEFQVAPRLMMSVAELIAQCEKRFEQSEDVAKLQKSVESIYNVKQLIVNYQHVERQSNINEPEGQALKTKLDRVNRKLEVLWLTRECLLETMREFDPNFIPPLEQAYPGANEKEWRPDVMI